MAGEQAQYILAIALTLAIAAAWWRRLGEEPGWLRTYRPIPIAMILIVAPLGLNPYYFPLHELWAGKLLALAFGLHRPGKWRAALVVTALALAIRELALPFVLLMSATAFWRRDWKEGIVWAALAAAFMAVLAIHLQTVAAHALPTDQPSDPWLAMRGLPGWLSNIMLSSPLFALPHWLAGPLVILTLTGWAGWRSPAGTFGTLLYLGYGLAFMIAGRANNMYWGILLTPAMFIGLPLAPRTIWSLSAAAFPVPAREVPAK